MDIFATAQELQVWLRTNYPKEDERHEWKEWRSLKSNISGRKGDDLISYVSALANMDGGCVVIGVQDKTLAVTGIQDFAGYSAENVVHRILGKTPGLPSMGLGVQALRASDTGAVVWLLQVPRHAPRELVLAHDQAWQRDGDSLTQLREDRRRAILTELIADQDWSAHTVAGATLADLDPEAIAKARAKYTQKHQSERWASEIADWSVEQFLAKAKDHAWPAQSHGLAAAGPGGMCRLALAPAGRNSLEGACRAHCATVWPAVRAHDNRSRPTHTQPQHQALS